MKKYFIIAFVIHFVCVWSQNENLSKMAFDSITYKESKYPIFSDSIVLLNQEKNTYLFGKRLVTISCKDISYEPIFTHGIFNMDVVFGKIETSENEEYQLHELFNNTKIGIFLIGEMKNLNPNLQTKRFVIWVFRKEVANPQEYYFELKNPNAKENSSLEEFLEQAYMSYFYESTYII